MAARGYAVLLPDPALSTGYGRDFIGRGWGAWGDAPYTDLMALTDAAAAHPRIDADAVAAMGGSFGGYMANWVAGHTDRFARDRHPRQPVGARRSSATRPTTPAYWRREMTPEMAARHSPAPVRRRDHDADARHPRRQGLPGADRRGAAAVVGPASRPGTATPATSRTGSCTSPTRTTGSSRRSTRSSGTRPCSRSSTTTCAARSGSVPDLLR